jgi:hypothetical protein
MTRLIAGEFHKLFTTRLWLWLLLAALAITALYTGLDIAFADNPAPGRSHCPLQTANAPCSPSAPEPPRSPQCSARSD